jgi:hypothetical protein
METSNTESTSQLSSYISTTSQLVALAGTIAFALQIVLALLMLRYFSPTEVGQFSVVSQIGFFSATLALAQSNLHLLANQGSCELSDAKQAWVSSVKRLAMLLPVIAGLVCWSGASFTEAFLWTLMLAFFQMTWMLAQSMRLRMESAWSQVGVRVLPSLMALVFAWVAGVLPWHGPVLLLAALLGYVVGAAWLAPALFDQHAIQKTKAWDLKNTTKELLISLDNRSASLRMAHSFVDVLLSVSVVVIWHHLYGVEETGWMAAPLRVMGFLPAIVHMSWVQVILAQPSPEAQSRASRVNPILVGFGGGLCVAFASAGCAVALEAGWLPGHWQGVWSYLLPVAIWQGSACLNAAYSHKPFQTHNSTRYSWMCMGLSVLQSLILLLPLLGMKIDLSPDLHMALFAGVSATGLLAIANWMRQLTSQP